jgi:[lysine-biosynthesis-protein LysW]--L-2-aminoadipate ligase
VVNDPATARVCADKVETSLALAAAGVPTPETRVAFDTESALAAVESFGYPCVLKPVVGSWGRLMAKLEGRAAAEAVLEHKATLGHYEHKVFYVQNFVEKPGRDLRVLVCGTEPVAAMSRSGDHWLTNAKRGAETAAFELDDRAAELATAAAEAVGGGLLGVDLMEVGRDDETQYTVHEVNHTVEFKALNDAVETDVPATVVDWLEATHGPETDDTGGTDDTGQVIAE